MTSQKPTAEQNLGMRMAILTQVVGILPMLVVTQGLLLLYLNARHIPSGRVLIYLSIFPLTNAALQLFIAWISDRMGLKRVGVVGMWFQFFGFSIILSSTELSGQVMEVAIVVGVLVFAMGIAGYAGGWYALLDPLVPADYRGRFFGKLRMSWQFVSLIFTIVIAFWISEQAFLEVYQIIFILMCVLLLVRIYFYRRIPELRKKPAQKVKFFRAIAEVLQVDGLMPFVCYVFLLALFAGAVPSILILTLKHALGWTDSQVVWMTIIMSLGLVLGFYLGGKLIDRYGTRIAFFCCHLGFGLMISCFVLRYSWPIDLVLLISIVFFGWGLLAAISSLAFASEILAIVPEKNKSISTSFPIVLGLLGNSLSGILVAGAMDLQLFSNHWKLLGHTLSQYDAILVIFASLVVLSSVSLGLVPSVIHKTQWMPRVGL